MRRCEDVKMFDRPPLLEEPFAQTLSGKFSEKYSPGPLVFYGPGNSLETKPSISVVFASFWKWSLSPGRLLQDIGPRNRAFAGLDAAVSTAHATLWSSIRLFSMVALRLTLV